MRISPCPSDLLGAHALDALDEEGHEVEAHLIACPRCRDEVSRHREVATSLVFDRAAPPSRVWERLIAELTTIAPATVDAPVPPQEPKSGSGADPGHRRPASPRVRRRMGTVFAALAATAASLVGIAALTNGSESSFERAALTAINDPALTKVQLASTRGRASGMVLLHDDRGYAFTNGLPELADGRTYQLWALDHNGQRSPGGVLGPDPRLAAFELDAPAAGFAITEEPAAGVRTSTKPPILIGWLEP